MNMIPGMTMTVGEEAIVVMQGLRVLSRFILKRNKCWERSEHYS
jgi:hypothetical protein